MMCFDQFIRFLNSGAIERWSLAIGHPPPTAPQQGIAFFARLFYFKAYPREGGRTVALKKQGSTKRAVGRKPTPENAKPTLVQSTVDTRRVYYAHELPADLIAELEKGFQGEPTPHLDHLLK